MMVLSVYGWQEACRGLAAAAWSIAATTAALHVRIGFAAQPIQSLPASRETPLQIAHPWHGPH
jgi:hypothetical protein